MQASSPVARVDANLAEIDRHDPLLRAMIMVMPEAARREAAAQERHRNDTRVQLVRQPHSR